MKRINGYLNIDGYFIKKYQRKYVEELIKKISSIHYEINIDGESYFFKKTDFPYNELLAYEIASFIGLNAVPYDLAIFQNMKGVISKNFKNDKCRYISGQNLLFEYSRAPKNMNYLENMGLVQTELNQFPDNAPYSYNINNLAVIWQAIEYRYNRLGIYVDMEKIMNDLILYFMFNILTLQNDGMAQNWMLEESDIGVNVVKCFDNELCFQIKDGKMEPSANLCTNFNDVGLNNYQILEEFLKTSDERYYELFKEKFEMLTMENFLKMIVRVENKIECSLPNNLKENYIKMFEKNRENIFQILESFEKSRN